MKLKHGYDQAVIDRFFTCPNGLTPKGKIRASKFDCLHAPVMALFLSDPNLTVRGASKKLRELHPDLPVITKSTLHYNLKKWHISLKMAMK